VKLLIGLEMTIITQFAFRAKSIDKIRNNLARCFEDMPSGRISPENGPPTSSS